MTGVHGLCASGAPPSDDSARPSRLRKRHRILATSLRGVGGLSRFQFENRGMGEIAYHLSHFLPTSAPKIWAWKEGRIRSIRRNVDHLLSILPFEVDYFSRRHHYPVEYVGNPSHDEVSAFLSTYEETREAFCVRHGWDDQRELIAVLAGSRRAEIADNLPRMLEAVRRVADPARYRVVLAAAPGISDEEYARYGISLSAASAATSDDAGKTAAALTSSATSSRQLPICAVRGETFCAPHQRPRRTRHERHRHPRNGPLQCAPSGVL